MSIVLDFVQRLVLQKAYELTQCAAYRVLGKCIKATFQLEEGPIKSQLAEPLVEDSVPELPTGPKMSDPPALDMMSEAPAKLIMPEPPANPIILDIKKQLPEPPAKLMMAKSPVKPMMPDIAEPSPRLRKSGIIWQLYDNRDLPRNNSGLIDPPQVSCMRVCRDSYFS
ncbi:uncharacterized protein [Drosophila pseudoobscura]|uniref:Uncharacterized protein isoform X1 n=1 Tax=Drosophila pseudoobscura pseudoobscura TaxID=46245 RepID=A0A6I8VUN5_DROPS|nr:uncharacterized protein LOC6898237 isoform X1 [Drosophila pseudoobscura]